MPFRCIAQMRRELPKWGACSERHGLIIAQIGVSCATIFTPLSMKMPCTSDQLRLFRSLFHGRDDVFARHWKSKAGKSGYSPAKFHTGAFAPLTDEIVQSHLKGETLIGIYPLLKDNTTWLLTVDHWWPVKLIK